MIKRRRRFKQHIPLQDRLAEWAKEVLATANALPPGPKRDAMLRRVRQVDVAAQLDGWAKPPALQPLKQSP